MSTSRNGVAAAGSWIVDKVKLIDTWPSQDALANILNQSANNGGGPFNVLVNLHQLGAGFPLEGIGLIGEDADGDWILEKCGECGIDRRQIRRTERASTSYTDVMTVQKTGRRTFFHQRGANALLDVEHIDLRESGARIFYLGYLLLLDRLDLPEGEGGTRAAVVLKAAQGLGMKTMVDLVSEDSDRFASVVRPALPFTDYAVMNEFEAARTTGIPLRDADEKMILPALEEAAAALFSAGVKDWVFIHFPEGAFAASIRGECLRVGSVRLPEGQIAGAAGAGDAFAAGVMLGLHEDKPMEECLRLGVCAAAASLQHASCSDGVGSIGECLALGARFGFREL